MGIKSSKSKPDAPSRSETELADVQLTENDSGAAVFRGFDEADDDDAWDRDPREDDDNYDDSFEHTCSCGHTQTYSLDIQECSNCGGELGAAGAASAAAAPSPRKRVNKRKPKDWTPEKSERVEKLKERHSDAAWKRLKACILVVDGGLTAKAACAKVGLSPENFSRMGWVRQYKAHGPEHILVADTRHKTTRLMTPETTKIVLEKSQLKKKGSSGDVQVALREHYAATGQEGRAVPSRRRIRFIASEHLKWVLNKRAPLFMVRTPWDARWRKQYAVYMLSPRTRPCSLSKFCYLDAKKFCIFDGSLGHRIEVGREPNIAKSEGFTDEEYEEWLQEVVEGNQPKTKSKGKYPEMVFGMVAVDFKPPLYFFDRPVVNGRVKPTKLTGPLYLEIVTKHFLPLRLATMPWYDQKMYLAADNDIKHVSIANRAALDARGSKVKRLVAPRLKADGSPDNFHGGPYGRTVAFPGLPIRSPDIQAAIEKCWRETQIRVLVRAPEISSHEDMRRVIKEEWDGLEFEETEKPWGKWMGINWWCKKQKDILQAVVDNDGWDTKYM